VHKGQTEANHICWYLSLELDTRTASNISDLD